MFSFLRKIKFRFLESLGGSKMRAKLYRKYYDIKIGENVRFTGKPIWGTESFLIRIGNNVTITQDVMFITHDGGVGIFRDEMKGINVFGEITIGNNVFIGARSIILPGVTVGDNVVIAAGSIVTKNVASNTVVAGVPAKKVKTINDYKQHILLKSVVIESSDPEKRKLEILKKMKLK